MLIGYARVSTEDQNLDPQVKALEEAGCERVFTDHASGAKAERVGLSEALQFARSGDTIVVWKLDRLGRSVAHLIALVADLDQRGVQFRSLTDAINTGTSSGRFFFHVMAALAEMERELIAERTRAGLAAARKKGRVGGRRRLMTESKVESARKLLDAGSSPREVAKDLGVSVPTLYRWLPATK